MKCVFAPGARAFITKAKIIILYARIFIKIFLYFIPIIFSICREFNVNENWLRYGKGPKYKENDGSFTELLSELEDSDDEFIKSLIKVYMGLDEDSKKALRKIAAGMAEKYKEPS